MTQPDAPPVDAPPAREQWETLRDDDPDLPTKVEQRIKDAFPTGAARDKMLADAAKLHGKGKKK